MKCPPLSFNAFAKLVRPRLLPREGIAGLSADDQQQLVSSNTTIFPQYFCVIDILL